MRNKYIQVMLGNISLDELAGESRRESSLDPEQLDRVESVVRSAALPPTNVHVLRLVF